MNRLGYALDCIIVELERVTDERQRRRLLKAKRALEEAAMPRRRWWRR